MKTYEQYLDDVDVMKIAHSAASKFKHCLSSDEIKSCIMNALLRATQRYDKRSKAKFTSYFYNGVVFECLSQRKFNRNKYQQLHGNITDSQDEISGLELKDVIENVCDDPKLVYDRFYGNMTIKELASQRGVCGETVRVRLNKNLEKIKSELEKSV